jgi:vacuolar-type H+-ATPase subunit H
MTMHVPGSDQRTDLRVVHNEDAGQAPEHALGLLENARRVADATVAEAKDEAERLLAAARERAAQVQREAREQGQKLRADAERESAQARHEAFGEAERLVADAKAQISSLEGSVAHLREEREKAVASTRVMRDRLSAALEAHTSDGDGHQQGDGPYEGQHHQG